MLEKNRLWDDLQFEIKNVGSSFLPKDNQQVLIGSGNREADILFLGDDPELYQNENFKVMPGSSGEFLYKLCDIEDIYPDQYYITTLTKKTVKIKEFLEDDVNALRHLLDMQIALIKPKLIVCLGAESSKFLLKREVDIESERGKPIHWLANITVLLTYDVNIVKKARVDSGKKSKIAMYFWNDLKTIKELEKNKK